VVLVWPFRIGLRGGDRKRGLAALRHGALAGPAIPMNGFLQRFGEEGARILLGAVLVGLLGIAAAVLARRLTRRGQVWIEAGAGRTRMSPMVLLLCLLCAAAAAGFLALGLHDRETLREPGQLYAWAGLVGAFAVCALAIAPFTRHTWEWDATGLRWRGAWRSRALRWPDIVRLGKAWDGRLFAADMADRRIYWSENTLAHEELLRAILRARPDLTPPE
jgi:hypothetical protein